MLSITIREKVQSHEYKYLISKGVHSYRAYNTERGFLNFLKVGNIQLDKYEPRVYDTKEYGKVLDYYINDVEIEEKSFWHQEDIPKNAIQFKDLCNGSYVDCYYVHSENKSEIFKPNPNAKDVYIPLSLEEHLEYSRVNG